MELGLALMVEWRELIVALTVPRPKTLDLLDGGRFFQVGPLMGKSRNRLPSKKWPPKKGFCNDHLPYPSWKTNYYPHQRCFLLKMIFQLCPQVKGFQNP